MTIATSAPVIIPSIATPNRMSNHEIARPAGDETNAESPWPRTVAIPQLNESKIDSNVQGFSNSVMRMAETSTTATMPSASDRKNRRSSCPPIRFTCQLIRRMSGLENMGRGRRDITA